MCSVHCWKNVLDLTSQSNPRSQVSAREALAFLVWPNSGFEPIISQSERILQHLALLNLDVNVSSFSKYKKNIFSLLLSLSHHYFINLHSLSRAADLLPDENFSQLLASFMSSNVVQDSVWQTSQHLVFIKFI